MSAVDHAPTNAPAPASNPHAGRRALWRWLRFVAALLITALLVPTAFFTAVLYSALVGEMFSVWWLADALLLVIVAVCVRGLKFGEAPASQTAALAIAATAWGLGCWMQGANYAGGAVPRVVILTGFFAASLWNFWLGWMTFWPTTWRRRLSILALLGMWPLAFASVFAVDDISGDEQLSFRWRFSSGVVASPRVEHVQPTAAAARPDLIWGDDYPQYLGPARNGAIAGPRLERDWRKQPPQLVWRIPVGAAWSGFALVGDLAITQEQRGEQEAVVAYDLATGRQRWARLDTVRFDGGTASGAGPRATPTVADDHVYALGGTAHLSALALETGAVQWFVDVGRQHGGDVQTHGASASPLVVDDLVVVCPSTDSGPTLAAYRRDDGQLVWKSTTVGPAYSSPVLADLCGERLVLQLDSGGLCGYHLGDGAVAWRFAWRSLGNHIAQPLVGALAPDHVLLASFDGGGAVLVAVSQDRAGAWTTQAVWKSSYLKTKFSTPIIAGPFAYGLDNGILACLDLATGKLCWKKGRYRHGQVLLVADLLLVLSEDGTLALVDPRPNGLIELGSLPALTGKTWNTLAQKGPLLVVRNASEAACFQLPTAGPAAQAKSSATTSP
jgi:outer membrane protein assembly factor BamB